MVVIVHIINITITISFLLGVVCAALLVSAHLLRRRQRNLPLSATANHQLNCQIATTLGLPVLQAMRVSEAALLKQLRLFTPEQRAVVGIWVLDPSTRIQRRQRERIVAALRMVEKEASLNGSSHSRLPTLPSRQGA